jgi:DNA repair exonuclease SbcCD ATPase subunit
MPTGHEGFDRAVDNLEQSIEERNRELAHLRSINADLLAALDRAAAELAQFRSLVPELVQVLQQVEWSVLARGRWHCPVCKQVDHEGHESDCELNIAIQKAES